MENFNRNFILVPKSQRRVPCSRMNGYILINKHKKDQLAVVCQLFIQYSTFCFISWTSGSFGASVKKVMDISEEASARASCTMCFVVMP